MKNQLLSVALAAMLFGCAGSHAWSTVGDDSEMMVVPLCRVVADPKKYDGDRIKIEGMFRQEPPGPTFRGVRCPDMLQLKSAPDRNMETAAETTLSAVIRKDQTADVLVVYDANFHILPNIQCSEVHCFRYGLEIHAVVRARAQPKSSIR